MSRRLLVTGGAGFIGSHLVGRLIEAGERVSVIDDLSRGRRAWLHPEVELHEADIRDADAVRRAVTATAADAVVHLAAMHFIPAIEGAPQLARDVNVNGTRRLLDALTQHPPALILFASTAAVYPDRRGPIPETCPAQPLDLYGRTKLDGELLVADFAAGTGTHCLSARIFNVVGRRETNAHVAVELVDQLRRGNTHVRLGNLEPRRDYTDVIDVAAALQGLLSAPREGPVTFNVGSGRSVAVADLVRICEEVLGRPIEVDVDQRRQRSQERAELVADARLLRSTTGWQPTRSLHETLGELLAESSP